MNRASQTCKRSPAPRRSVHATLLGRLRLAALLLLWASMSLASPTLDSAYFESVDGVDDLPSRTVTALAHDRHGLLWIGTQRGLVRYDGYRFRPFSHRRDDPTSLAADFVQCLLVTRNGEIWVGSTSDGLSVFDPGREVFRRLRHDPALPEGLGAGSVWSLAEDAEGGVWVGSDSGLDRIHLRSRSQRAFRGAGAAGLQSGRILALAFAADGRLWVGGADGLQFLDPGSERFERLAGDAGFAGEMITVLRPSPAGLWVGTRGGGLWLLDPPSGARSRPQEPARELADSWVRSVEFGNDGALWAGTTGAGLFEIDARAHAVRRQLRNDPAIRSSLALDNIGALLRHESGLLWVGTWGSGVQRYNLNNEAFRVLRSTPSRAEALSHPDVRALVERGDGEWLIGTSGNGVDRWSASVGRIGGLRRGEGNPDPLADSAVLALAEAEDGSVWIGTRQAGVYRADASLRRLRQYAIEHGLPNNKVNRLWARSADEAWIGTDGGIARWRAGKIDLPDWAGLDGLRSPIGPMQPEGRDRLWVGARDGLWLLDLVAQTAVRFQHEPGRSDSLIHDKINGLLLDRQGRLWVDTADGLDRLLRVEDGRAHFERFDDVPGMAGEYFGGNLLEDAKGRIWSQWRVFDPLARQLHLLSRADGVDIGTAWAGSATRLRDGRLLFGGSDGLLQVEPDRFAAWNYRAPLVATALRIDGSSRPLGELVPALRVPSSSRSFAIDMSSLDYSAPQRARYAYRLHGFDADWIEADAGNRTVSYSNLWPGDYRLELRGSNRVGQFGAALIVPVSVLPAFWQTGAFAVAVAMLSALALWRLHSLRLRRVRQRNRDLSLLVEQRTADLRAQTEHLAAQNDELDAYAHSVAHDLKNPLTALIGAAALIEQGVGRLPPEALSASAASVNRSARKMTAIIDALLLLGSVRRSQDLQLSPLAMDLPVADALSRLAAQIAQREASVSAVEEWPLVRGYPPWVEQIWINLLGNALKYGGTRPRIEVLAESDAHAERCRFLCRDHGPGIPAAQRERLFRQFSRIDPSAAVEGHGLGLSIVKRMVDRMGGEVGCDETPGGGATFWFSLPRIDPVRSGAADRPAARAESAPLRRR